MYTCLKFILTALFERRNHRIFLHLKKSIWSDFNATSAAPAMRRVLRRNDATYRFTTLLDQRVANAGQSACRDGVYTGCKHGNDGRRRRWCEDFECWHLHVKYKSGACLVFCFLSIYGAAVGSVMGLYRVYGRDVLDWTVSWIAPYCRPAWRFVFMYLMKAGFIK